MFFVSVGGFGDHFEPHAHFGPFDTDEDAQQFKEKMEADGSRRVAQVEEMSTPF